MSLSSDRQNYLVHLVVDRLEASNMVRYANKEQVLMLARRTMTHCMKECEEMDQKVRNKILSLKRNVMENSSEWEVLYSNYLEDEMVRRV